MPLSAGLIKSLGGPTLRSFKEEESDPLSKTQDRIDNARARLDSLGYEAPEQKDSFLVSVLKNLSRTGYAANNMIREFTDKDAGSTPGEFDPFKAFGRGLSLKEQVEGKDITEGLGLEGDKGIFGGENKIYNPSAAGMAGLALDILNPLDLLNWLSFGMGKAAIKGGSVGAEAIAKTFGSKADDILKVAGDLSTVKAGNVGELVAQLSNKSNLTGNELSSFIKSLGEGLVETGAKAGDKVSDLSNSRKITVGLQNPLTLGRGKEFLKTEIPGTGPVGGALTSLGDAFKKSRLGNEISKRFSTKYVPTDVPDIVVMRNLTGYQLDNIVNDSTAAIGDIPFTKDELMTIKGTLDQVKSMNSQATIKSISDATGFDSRDLLSLFENEIPFTFDVVELFNAVKKYHPDLDKKVAFLQSVKLRKVMDDIYGDIPDNIKDYFKGTVKLPEPVKSYSDVPTMMDDVDQMNVDSPMLSYVFNVKGVDVVVPIKSTGDFNPSGLEGASRIIKAIEGLDERNLNAIKGQVRAMPGELGVIDGDEIRGYYHNSDIVLRQPQEPGELGETIPHEFGHSAMDSYSIDPEEYQAKAMGSSFIDEYAKANGPKEDFATSVEWMKNRPNELLSKFPERYNYVKELMDKNKMTPDELLSRISSQGDRSFKMEGLGGTKTQLDKVMERVDGYVSSNLISKSGREAYTEFKGKMHELYEEVSLSKVEDFVQQVEQIFKNVPVEERKAIMDIASGLHDDPSFLAPTFYNKSEQVIEAKMGNKMPTAELRKMLLSNGVKSDELKWLGLDELMGSKSVVTKDEVMEHIAMNNLEVKDNFKSLSNGPVSKPESLSDVDDEMISLVMGDIAEDVDEENIIDDIMGLDDSLDWDEAEELYGRISREMGQGTRGMTRYGQYRTSYGDDYKELVLTLPEKYGPYRSNHWSEDNVVAHVRFDTQKVGDEKVLFIQEMQSDWHQQGRKVGYANEVSPKQRKLLLDSGVTEEDADLMLDQLSKIGYIGLTPADGTEWYEVMGEEITEALDWPDYLTDEQVADIADGLLENYGGIPKAPFEKTWPNLLMKRMLRYASENGYDRIAWATGEQNAKVFSLSRSFDSVEYNPTTNKLIARSTDGTSRKLEGVTPDKLVDYVGDDVAKKLMSKETKGSGRKFEVRPPDKDIDGLLDSEHWAVYSDDGRFIDVFDTEEDAWNWIIDESDNRKVEGIDLEMGGEGMKGFYNDIVPKNFNSYLKKFGIKTEKIDLSNTIDASKLVSSDRVMESFIPSEVDYDYIMDMYDNYEEGLYEILDEVWIDMAYNGSPDPEAVHITKTEMDKVVNHIMEAIDSSLTPEGARKVNLNSVKGTIERSIKKNLKLIDDDYVKSTTNQSVKLNDQLKDMVLNQGQPLFRKNRGGTKATPKLSKDGEAALKAFYNWRQSVVKMYNEAQIPMAEMEKYVPFIPQRPLKGPERTLLNSLYGTGTTTHEIDPIIQRLAGTDHNLLERTTKANTPSEVNKLLDKPWLTEDAAVAMATRGARAIRTTELSKALDGLITQYGRSYDEILSQSTTGGIPAGYKMYIVSQENGRKVLQEVFDSPKLASKNVKSFFIPEEMAKVYNMYADLIMGEEKKGALLKLFDQATSAYKKVAYLWNPGHVIRDFEGNVFNNYLMGVVNPAEYLKAAKLLRSPDSLIKVDGVDITVKELLERSRKVGLLDVGSATAESPYDIMNKLKSTEKNLLQKAGGKYTQLMREGTRKADMFTRFTGLVHNLENGMSFNEAATEVKKFLFDYFELTPFERKVMKRIIPFYTWMRKNIPLQVEQVMKNPRNYSRIESTMAAAEGDTIDWEGRPDYINDTGSFKMGEDGDYASLSLPFNDLSRVPTSLDSILQLLSGVNPVIKAPIEMATNQQWFNGRPLEEYPNETREAPFAGILKLLGVSDEDIPRIDKRTAGYLFDQVPILRNLDVITNPDNPRQVSRASSFLGGPSIYTKESVEKSEMYETERILADFLKKLKDEGIEVQTMRELKKQPNKLIKIRDMLR